MGALAYEEAFKRYKTKLKNRQWSVCAETTEGELVISCWQNQLNVVKAEGKWQY